MDPGIDEAFRATVLYRTLSADDRARLAEVSVLRSYDKGAALFSEGDPSDFLYTIVTGRAKVVKLLPSGKEVILEIFGPGDPVGAVVAYEGRPYPATAVASVSVKPNVGMCTSSHGRICPVFGAFRKENSQSLWTFAPSPWMIGGASDVSARSERNDPPYPSMT